MELVHFATDFRRLGDVARLAGERPLIFSCRDADTVLCAGSMRTELQRPIGVWLEISEGYVAQLAARDVATLSWLVALDTVVVSAGELAEQHADVVRALLTNDQVNICNDVATVVGAFNRPAPPSPVAVWSWNGTTMQRGAESLTSRSAWSDDAGDWTKFA